MNARVVLAVLAALGMGAFFAFGVTNPYVAMLCGVPLAVLIRFEVMRWRGGHDG